MGYAKVFWIQEEPIREYISVNGLDDAIIKEVGRRILSLSAAATSGFADSDAPTSLPLFDTPSVFFALDPLFHSTDFRLLIWTGNRLCPLETSMLETSMFDSLCQLTDTVGISHAVLSISDSSEKYARVLPNSVAKSVEYARLAQGERENPLEQKMWASLYWIYDDFSPKFKGVSEENRLCTEVGNAVLDLMFSDLSSSAQILDHGNALNRCCSFKQPEFTVIVWRGNCLRLLSNIEDDKIQQMRDYIEDKRDSDRHRRRSV